MPASHPPSPHRVLHPQGRQFQARWLHPVSRTSQRITPPFCLGVFSEAAERVQHSSRCIWEVGGVHTPWQSSLGNWEMNVTPPSPRETILIHSSSEGVLHHGALLPKDNSQPAPNTPYVGSASFPVSPPPSSCFLHHLPSQAQHLNPSLGLCFGGT